MKVKVVCLLVVIALFAQGWASEESAFTELEQQALNEVADALNRDLLEGNGFEEHLSDNPAALVEMVSQADLSTEAEAEAEAETEVEAEESREPSIYDHFFDDEEDDRPPKRRPSPPTNTTLPAPIQPSIPKPSEASPAVQNQTAKQIATAKAVALAKTAKRNNSVSWEDRRRYSYNDADMDGVDDLANKGEGDNAEEELQKLLSDPDLEIYASDKDKGIYFGPSKKDERKRFLGLRKAIRESKKQAKTMKKLVKMQRAAAKMPPGSNVTAAVNATTTPKFYY